MNVPELRRESHDPGDARSTADRDACEMDRTAKPGPYRIEIRIRGVLGEQRLVAAFTGLEVETRVGETALTGTLPDQAALYGVLGALEALGLQLIAVRCEYHPALEDSVVLTQRQLDVLRLLATGKTTHEIAEKMSLSPTTIRNHIANLLVALNAHSRLQAVVAAREAGLLDA